MTRPTCSTCKWSANPFPSLPLGSDDLLECQWPADRLPYSLRWGNRERVSVAQDDPPSGTICPQHATQESRQ